MIDVHTIQLIKAAGERHLPHVRRLRQALHQIPEPGLEENKTSALLHTELLELGLKVIPGFGTTGLVADLRQDNRDSGYVILRADIDGLPVQESSDAPYHSRHQGYSHCCGHDGHAACLIGAARILLEVKECWQGRIRLLFQPAEEISRGAQRMIEAGLFRQGLPTAIIALHAWPGMPAGSVAGKAGTMMASSDSFRLTVTGRGGHGARPALARNPLFGIARAGQQLAAMTDHTRVVSPCVARVGEKVNVIAASGYLAGTLRTLDQDTRERTMSEMTAVCKQVCAQEGLECRLEFEAGCPCVSVSAELYQRFRQLAVALLGKQNVNELDKPSMGSEDLGFYLEHVPGLMFRLGMGTECPELHNPAFDFSDHALSTGMQMLAALAVDLCRQPAESTTR